MDDPQKSEHLQRGAVLHETLRVLPPDQPIILDNVTCPYCGGDVRKRRTKEHVVGRRFVPKGMLNRQWNLILWACGRCNGRKADLENDISAITLQPDRFGRHADADLELLPAEAKRRASKTFSRRTKKLVQDSVESITLKAPLAPGVHLTGNWSCSPQVNPGRLAELAQMQAGAFFYFATYRRAERAGRLWRGPFMLVNATMRLDWGNVLMRSFMDAVVGWEPRVLAIGAGEFFKVAIRKHPQADCWSWAFEWNKNVRAIGFFGDEVAARTVASKFAALPIFSIVEGPDAFVRAHWETRLASADDKLFCWPGMEAESA